MRTTGQIGLALFAIIVLVAGVTYLAQYGPSNSAAKPGDSSTSGPKSEGTGDKPPDLGTIAFANQKVEWTERNEGDFEKALKGYHDMWFRNSSSKPTVIGLEFKNCKCTDAEIMPLSEAQLRPFKAWLSSSSATVLAGMERGPLVGASLMAWETLAVPKLFGLDMKWQGLEQGKETVKIPPYGGGLLRIHFEGKKDLVGAFLVRARLWAEPEGEPKNRTIGEVEMPINYVPPIDLTNGQINLETFNAGDVKSGESLIYSTTEGGFDLFASLSNPSPFIDVKIEDLTPEEIADYKSKETLEKRVIAAKRIKVTVHERKNDGQRMDLGPFYRKINLSRTKDEPEDAQVIVTGEVHGELVVGAPEDRGRIDLKTFRASTGTSKTIAVLAQQPNLELDTKDIGVYPESLQPHIRLRLEKLKPVGGEQRNRWHLHVTLDKGFPPGKMPEGSAVFLRIAGSNPPRQIRIPINGMAYQ